MGCCSSRSEGSNVKKPVIYLYPKEDLTPITVDVSLRYGKFSCVYPSMNNGRWKVIASPNGDIIDQNDTSKKYPYLFWEGKRGNSWGFDDKKAYCIAGKDCVVFLEDVLTRLGLNYKEKTDFITYWAPKLTSNSLGSLHSQTRS